MEFVANRVAPADIVVDCNTGRVRQRGCCVGVDMGGGNGCVYVRADAIDNRWVLEEENSELCILFWSRRGLVASKG